MSEETMAITVGCSCGKRYSVEDKYAGKKMKCRQCGAVLAIGAAGGGSGAGTGAVRKICVGCGQDVSQQPRTRDAQGNYYCKPCYAARTPGAAAVAPAPAHAAAAPGHDYVCATCFNTFAVDDVYDDGGGKYVCKHCYAARAAEAAAASAMPSPAELPAMPQPAMPTAMVAPPPPGAQMLQYSTPPLAAQFQGLTPLPYFLMAGLLLVGYIFPVVAPGRDGSEVHFLNIELMSEKGVPFVVQFLAMSPLLFGVLAASVGKFDRVWRPLSVLGLLGLTVVIVMAGANEMARDVPLPIKRSGGGTALIVGLLAMLGLLGMLVGAWVFMQRPNHRAGAIVAASGAGLYLLALIIPVTVNRETTIGLFSPFKAFGELGSQPMGFRGERISAPASAYILVILSILQLATLIGAAALSFITLATRDENKAKLACGCVLGAVGLIVVQAIIAIFAMQAGDDESLFLCKVTLLIKAFTFLGGLMMVLPVCLADLLIGVIPDERTQVRRPAGLVYQY